MTGLRALDGQRASSIFISKHRYHKPWCQSLHCLICYYSYIKSCSSWATKAFSISCQELKQNKTKHLCKATSSLAAFFSSLCSGHRPSLKASTVADWLQNQVQSSISRCQCSCNMSSLYPFCLFYSKPSIQVCWCPP